MSKGLTLFLPILLLYQAPQTSTANISQMEALHQHLLAGYNTALLPRETTENPVEIQVTAQLLSINDFNEISGILKTSMMFKLEWMDFRMKWQPPGFGGMGSFQMPSTAVWKPELYLRESAFKYEPLGYGDTGTVRISSSGSILWNPGEILYSSCSVDALKFPFDRQVCDLNFTPKNTLTTELVLNMTADTLQLQRFVENSQWELMACAIDTTTIGGNGGEVSSLKLQLNLKRRNLFYVYYILCPLFFLAFLNKLVFFMLPDSGERTGVAVTIFLAFVVYMDVINANVPASSNPVAFIYTVILLLMMYSTLIMLMCIVSSRIYLKSTEVPKWVRKTVHLLRLGWIRNRKISSTESLTTTDETGHTCTHPDKTTRIGNKDMYMNDVISWAVVGKTIDLYCYITCAMFLMIGIILVIVKAFEN